MAEQGCKWHVRSLAGGRTLAVVEVEVAVEISDAERTDLVAGGGAEADHQSAAAAEHDGAPPRLQRPCEGVADRRGRGHDLAMPDKAAARVAPAVVHRCG